MLSKFITAAACLLASVTAQTPPGYTWAQSNSSLYLKYWGFPIFPAGSVLPYAEPYYEPLLYSSKPLNGTYIVFLVDSNYNNSASIPAEVLWIASGVQFAPVPAAVPGQNSSVYQAGPVNSSRVPYKAPTVPGHTYVALMYNSPPNFAFPPAFPYNATVRTGFNVTRIGADLKSPTVEATYFTIASNASVSASGTGGSPHPTGTGAYGTGYAPTASIVPFIGSANSMYKVGETWTWTWSLVACAITGAMTGLL